MYSPVHLSLSECISACLLYKINLENKLSTSHWFVFKSNCKVQRVEEKWYCLFCSYCECKQTLLNLTWLMVSEHLLWVLIKVKKKAKNL